ncbi:uncharacterized protein N7477_003685 [Penicillium maclennaniae]|uniref:uncharacterized protein n=1 Tax=Penicillium maclennaniae TaxID=1343394 RepID=UPI0025420518|nr:uncharacterized protein N7477_003685 [Penicillium maclennaniae]KAJ5678052.1 hypothetical protein N7477_003685 [Penicillium maclennaniae]
MDVPRNRKQRRAAAATSSSPEPSIPLAIPPRNQSAKKSERTLYDIIAERQNELLGQQAVSQAALDAELAKGHKSKSKGPRYVTVDASGNVVDANASDQVPMNNGARKISTEDTGSAPDEPDKPLPPFIDTVLLSVPLTTLHLTLAYVAAHQYAERIDLPRLLKESFTITLPFLTFFIHFAHGHIIRFRLSKRLSFLAPQPISILPLTPDKFTFSFLRRLIFPPSLRTIVFLPAALLLGAHLISVTNGEPYYGVMKKAPAFGTIWIWCILEMSFGAALIGALAPLAWGVWWMGYGIV